MNRAAADFWNSIVERRQLLAAIASLSLFMLALWALHRELAHTHLSDILRALRQMPSAYLLLACLATAGSYLALTGYDMLALRYLGRSLPYRRVALASFVATAVGHNIGMAMLPATAVRLRMYTAWGLDAAEVATMIVLVGSTFGIGACFASGTALLAEPALAGGLLHIGAGGARAVGLLLLALALLYVAFCLLRRRPIQIWNWQIRMPGADLAVAQLALACVDLSCAAFVLYALLPETVGVSFPMFLSVYLIAVVAGIASHVPGGVGVFETVLLLALPDVPRDALLASILIYRILYYLAPLALAALLAAVFSTSTIREHVASRLEMIRKVVAWTAPMAVGGMVFFAGVVLLFSGSLPAVATRIHLMRGLVPLAVLEISHLVGSLIGLGLIILAQALYRRVDAAYHVTFWLLVAGALASLLKGLDYEEALVSMLVLSILWLGRRAFYRKASIMAGVFTPAWFALLILVLASTVWLGMFAHKHVEYSNDLWWRFTFMGDAPRFLRASLLLMLAVVGLGLLRLMQPAPPEPGQPSAHDMARVERIVAHAPQADAALALLGDKRILFDQGGDAFLMYQIRGRSWIAMGDPVGPSRAREALAWRFREMADRHGGRVAFYQVDPANLALYLDLGLSAVKLGEEALVPLQDFSLDGPHRAQLRQAHRRAAREGLRFEMVAADAVPALMPQLQQVSDAWLTAKHTREKGFSLGFFEPDYLARFPCALVWQGERLLAFANIWASAQHRELSIDLMRHLPDAPKGIMDYLFIELMLYGQREGYRQFNLGMAPLAGLESHPLAPIWHRVGTLIFRQGEHFYNFKGLRVYKDKFSPVWRPKYLVAQGGLGLPTVLLDVAALIAGGVRNVFLK